MSNKMSNKKQSGATKEPKQYQPKQPVYLRERARKNGNISLYLDIYRNGKHTNEFLGMYLIPEKNEGDRVQNKNTRALANKILIEKINTLNHNASGFNNAGGIKSKVNIFDYIRKIAEEKQEKSKGNKRGTYHTYIALAHHLKAYSGEKTTLKHIDKQYCIDFIKYLKTARNPNDIKSVISTNTQAFHVNMLNSVINIAISEELMNTNPLKFKVLIDNMPKKNKPDIPYLTIEEVKMLIKTECGRADIKQAFLFLCFCGLRYSDMKALTWGKFSTDSEGETQINFTIKKTDTPDHLPISKEALQFLPERRTAADTDFVFNMISNGYGNVFLKQWAASAGISTKKVTWHVARHTFATLLLNSDVSREVTASLLGHTNTKTVDIYAKMLGKTKRTNVDKLNGLLDNIY
jgi:integrase